MTSNATVGSSPPLLERVSPELVPELRRYHLRHRQGVEDMVRTGSREAGLAAGQRHAKAFDGLLSALFHAAHAAMIREKIWWPVSLAAVGSYGRGAVSLHSDLDVRLVTRKDAQRAAPVAEALLYPLWDSGLSVGHQVITADDTIDLARTDLPTATSLLDWRHVAGDGAVGEAMLARAYEGVFGPGNLRAFIERLGEQAEERAVKYGGSVFLLEPDVKNGAGGIRDLDIAQWAARARWHAKDLADCVRLGVLVPREILPLEAALSFIWRVRNLLHFHAGRRSDRLSFEQQEQIAERMGYGSKGPDVERFMSDYYRHARTALRGRDAMLLRALPPPRRRPVERRLGGGLKTTNEKLSFVDPADLEEDPALALRLYDEAIKRNLEVYPFARDAVMRAATSPAFAEKLRKSPEAAQLFVKLCTDPQEARVRGGSILAELHDVGLLVAMIPEFAPVVGRVHHDVYHVYTVDVHSVAAVERLSALCRGDLAEEHPMACRVAAEIVRPRVLFLATLLHDIGKDIGGRSHSERGRELAGAILGRLGLSEADVAEVQHLVLKHLRMYHVATRRDVDDPKTLEEFAADVHGVEGLRELYLLTISDVSTTSPTAFTSWKARMLDDLYAGAERWLLKGGSTRADGDGAAALRAAVLERCPHDEARDFARHYLAAMPVRYLYANDPDAMAAHVEFAVAAAGVPVRVRAFTEDAPYVEIGVTAEDRPGLLAVITAAMAAARFKVVGGQIYSWKDAAGTGRALDLFWVRSGQDAANVHAALPRLERELARLLAGEITPEALVAGTGRAPAWNERATPRIATRVHVDNRCATDHTVIEVLTRDRVGLLFALASTLQKAGLVIDLAKINTEGNRVADVFYVTDADGTKLTDSGRIQALEADILARVETLEAETAAG